MFRTLASLSAEKRLEYIIANLRENDYLIVPEQFLFETERNMYGLLGARKIGGINITGLSRLSADIIKRHAGAKLYADNVVKFATMYKTVARLSSSFVYYKRGGDSARLAERMLDLTADLKAAGITPSLLRRGAIDINLSSANDEALSAKISDVTEIYCAYCETLETEYSDKLDDAVRAAALIREHGGFSGTRVFVYEFDGFSESQITLLNAIADSSEGLSVLLRTDAMKSENRDFFAINSLINRFRTRAADFGGDFEHTDLGGEPNEPKIELWLAKDVYEECAFTAAKIRGLITEEGYSCGEIAVLTCQNDIMPKLTAAFSDYGITAFADLPEPIIKKPLARFIITALEAVSLETDKFLAYVRSGFVRVSANFENFYVPRRLRPALPQTDRRYGYAKIGGRFTKRLSKRNMDSMERAARRWALTKKEWGAPFPSQNAELHAIEPLRGEIVSALTALREAARDASGDRITEAVCSFLIDGAELGRTVLGLCNSRVLGEAERKALTDEYRQLWDLIVGIFESLHDALKGFKISLDGYTRLLRTIFSSVNIAKPPQVLDAVTVGDPERTRLNGARAVFVVGANMDAFPKSAARQGEFSGAELETLFESGLKIKAKRLERYRFERFIVNKALTLPSERLYISAPLRNGAWEETRPSPVFDVLKKSGRAEGVNSVSDLPLSFFARTLKTVRGRFAESLGDGARRDAEILRKALNAVGDGAFAERLEGRGRGAEHSLNPETAEKLLGFDYFSPTRLETLMGCRFKFFCGSGLGIYALAEQNNEEPTALERGNIIHFCLDALLRGYARQPEKFSGLSAAELDAAAERCIGDYRDTKLPRGYALTKRQEYILKSFKPGLLRMFGHIRDDYENGGFKPDSFEKRVDFLFGGVCLTGKIDRIDSFSDPPREYVRVVDYKTGAGKKDFSSVFYGLNMQQLLYLFAVCEQRGAFPASALYMPANGFSFEGALEPENGSVSRNASEIRKNWLAAHISEGIYIADGSKAEEDFLKQIERYKQESGGSRMTTVNARGLTPAAYEKLKDHCSKLIKAQIRRAVRGNVAAVPVVSEKGEGACDYCDYLRACGGDKTKKAKIIDRNAIERVIGE
ncbi:MAG: PD-(D/E)XK nuclease family protein [Oscillospiraceae bacterium]|jgi:ATP-dependent helicase/nuclease subunit B|nr:PD-(D/E)XK nuclease family protein [Oscillospiraceae bacterium]